MNDSIYGFEADIKSMTDDRLLEEAEKVRSELILASCASIPFFWTVIIPVSAFQTGVRLMNIKKEIRKRKLKPKDLQL